MSKIDVSELRGPLTELMEQLAGENGAERMTEFKLWLKKVSGLFKRITEVAVSATKKFIAKDHIKSANVVFMNDRFKALFLNKVEKDVPESMIVVGRLKKASLDGPIMTELGNKKKTFLAHFFELLERQSKGQAGLLLSNGCANVAYIQDDGENFWAVGAYWGDYGRGWSVFAGSVEYPLEWREGSRVLFCK